MAALWALAAWATRRVPRRGAEVEEEAVGTGGQLRGRRCCGLRLATGGWALPCRWVGGRRVPSRRSAVRRQRLTAGAGVLDRRHRRHEPGGVQCRRGKKEEEASAQQRGLREKSARGAQAREREKEKGKERGRVPSGGGGVTQWGGAGRVGEGGRSRSGQGGERSRVGYPTLRGGEVASKIRARVGQAFGGGSRLGSSRTGWGRLRPVASRPGADGRRSCGRRFDLPAEGAGRGPRRAGWKEAGSPPGALGGLPGAGEVERDGASVSRCLTAPHRRQHLLQEQFAAGMGVACGGIALGGKHGDPVGIGAVEGMGVAGTTSRAVGGGITVASPLGCAHGGALGGLLGGQAWGGPTAAAAACGAYGGSGAQAPGPQVQHPWRPGAFGGPGGVQRCRGKEGRELAVGVDPAARAAGASYEVQGARAPSTWGAGGGRRRQGREDGRQEEGADDQVGGFGSEDPGAQAPDEEWRRGKRGEAQLANAMYGGSGAQAPRRRSPLGVEGTSARRRSPCGHLKSMRGKRNKKSEGAAAEN